MLSGFNTNIRHRGVLFHVQTEDSGRNAPHVITHLFYGGNILASEKQDYAHLLDAGELEPEVRALMERQHKAMLKRLRAGEYDRGIEARLGPGAWQDGSGGASGAGDEASPGDTQPSSTPPGAQAGARSSAAGAAAESPQDRLARSFGDGIVSEKPLDEVVLDYLVESARKRKRSSRAK